MNTRKSTWLKIFCITLIPLMLMIGCAKRDAQKAMTVAQAAKDEASAARAPGYARTAFDDANRLFNQAQQQFDAGSYKEAIDLYQQAEARFRSSKEIAIEKEPVIRALVEKIDEAIALASSNMDKARAGNVLTAEQLNPVQTVVDNLNQRMESEIRAEVDEEQLNAFYAEVEQAVAQTESLALAHLKPQAMTAKDEIQTLITRAQELKGDIHAPQQYGAVMQQFQQMNALEQDGKWQEMIDLAEQMKAPLDQVIVASQEKAAGDILRQVGQQIAQAEQLGVQGVEAFTTAVQQAKSALEDGQAALQAQDYSGAINASDLVKGNLQQAYQAVGQQAQTLLAEAKAHLQDALDQEAEKYASSVVAQVQEAIAGSEELLNQENYVQAYTAAQRAQKASSQAVDAARRGKAQLALNTVEQPFSVLHAQGGAQYAPDAYKQALAQVQDLRGKMKSGQYEEVAAGSPDAKTVVESALNALGESAAAYIGKAEAALNDAKASGAPEWVGVQYANAVNLKSAAERDQQSDKYLSSIRNAESAIQSAHNAEAKAYQLQTDQNLRKVDEFMALAKRAEQDRLSPLAYRRALESREETAGLLQANQEKKAYETSLEAVQKADRALNNLVMTAQEKTDSALKAGAKEYSEPEINQALSYLTKAEEAQKAQNFAAANEMSVESANLAEKAEHFTWQQRSYRLLKELEGSKEELEYHLTMEKAPALYQKTLANLAEAKVLQIDENYKESYDHAAQADAAKQGAWDAMKGELTQILEDLKDTADWMGENALDASGRELKMDLMDAIPELEANIALQDWRAAYASAERCMKSSDRIMARFEQRNRSIMSKNLQASAHPYQKVGALSVVPEKKEQIRETYQTLLKPGEDETYADVKQKYDEASKELDQMPSTITAEASQRTEEIASILQQAEAAGASQYYEEWLRDLSSDLQMLRNAVRGENLGEIAKYNRKLEREAPRLLAATQEAAAEDEYLSELEKNLNQMANVFNDLGFLASVPKRLMTASRLTEHKLDDTLIDMYKSLQTTMSVRTFEVNAKLLQDNVKSLNPPKSLERVHKKALKSFDLFHKASEGFVIYGDTDAFDIYYREKAISRGYDCLQDALKINESLLYQIKTARKLSPWEKFEYSVDSLGEKFGDFYFNWGS
ncbi:MAG: hypothetical protein JXR73_05845 [Candidatus Omnitrophica bacterium]|nr:hypothetical protein [Candidatus Omnitrophota bacterium]